MQYMRSFVMKSVTNAQRRLTMTVQDFIKADFPLSVSHGTGSG